MLSTGEGTPFFTVVMATYGRGRHILPSITSVLRQDLPDFELLVVGDATTDETERVVGSIADPRLRWLNLPKRWGSQSGPNNAGIEAARGAVIAYLGHDDIWEPDHLSRLAALYRSADPPDFAVSGAIFHLPSGLPGGQVTGLFADGEDVRPYFFPPSSFSHRRAVTQEIGPWRMARDCQAPVDEDVLIRARGAGMTFRSTGVVTLHKFAAGHRYLSYLRQESDEQSAMLAALGTPGHAERIAALVEAARRQGTYMERGRRDYSRYEPGELARRNAERKGLRKVELQPLGRGVTLRHRPEQCAYDWRMVPRFGFRRSKANPKPKLLLPVTGGRARLVFRLFSPTRAGLAPIDLRVKGEPVVARPGLRWFLGFGWIATYRSEIDLHPDAATMLDLHLSAEQRPAEGQPGVAIGPLVLTPV